MKASPSNARQRHGYHIDDQMRRYDRQYFDPVADIPESELDPEQRSIAMRNAYGKIQAALNILVGRNPEIMLRMLNDLRTYCLALGEVEIGQ